jgi:hypothetical protein
MVKSAFYDKFTSAKLTTILPATVGNIPESLKFLRDFNVPELSFLKDLNVPGLSFLKDSNVLRLIFLGDPNLSGCPSSS